jgi:hypothetical protein
LNRDFRRHAFSPEQLLNKKQKNGLVKMGRGIACLSGRQVLPFSKTQPVFCFLCAVGLRRLPCGKRWAFLSFGLQKKKNSALAQHVLFCDWCLHQQLMIYPLIAAGARVSRVPGQKIDSKAQP